MPARNSDMRRRLHRLGVAYLSVGALLVGVVGAVVPGTPAEAIPSGIYGSFSAPAGGATVSGTVNVEASALTVNPWEKITGLEVRLLQDGSVVEVLCRSSYAVPPDSATVDVNWNTTTSRGPIVGCASGTTVGIADLDDGEYQLRMVASELSGSNYLIQGPYVTVDNVDDGCGACGGGSTTTTQPSGGDDDDGDGGGGDDDDDDCASCGGGSTTTTGPSGDDDDEGGDDDDAFSGDDDDVTDPRAGDDDGSSRHDRDDGADDDSDVLAAPGADGGETARGGDGHGGDGGSDASGSSALTSRRSPVDILGSEWRSGGLALVAGAGYGLSALLVLLGLLTIVKAWWYFLGDRRRSRRAANDLLGLAAEMVSDHPEARSALRVVDNR